MKDAASLDVPRQQRIALAISMFLTTAVIGFLQPFVLLYLQASGLRAEQIGLVMGSGSGLALFAGTSRLSLPALL